MPDDQYQAVCTGIVDVARMHDKMYDLNPFLCLAESTFLFIILESTGIDEWVLIQVNNEVNDRMQQG